MLVKELLTKWLIDVDDSDVEQMEKKFQGAQKQFKALGEKSIGLGKTLTGFVTAPILALGAGMISVASDASETRSKFNTIFKDMQGGANETADAFAKDFGLAGAKSRQLLGDTADLLASFKFTQEEALDLSKATNSLAVDLASFTNFAGGAEGASAALTKGLLGEREGMKALGISISEVALKARVKDLVAQGKAVGQTEKQTRALATLQLAQEQSGNAIGDFSRTSQGFANQMRILRGRISDVAEKFGAILLPTATKILKVVIKIVDFFNDMSDTTRTVILVILGLAAVIGPLLLALGLLLTLIGSITGALAALGLTLGAALLQFLIIPAAVVLAFAALFLIFEDIIAFFKGEDSVTAVIINGINTALDFLQTKFKGLSVVGKIIVSTILTPIRAAFQAIQALGGAIGALVSGDFSGALGAITEGFKNTFTPDLSSIRGVLGLTGGLDKSAAGTAAPTGTGSAAAGNTTISMKNEISVPPDTPPEVVGSALASAAEKVMDKNLRSTNQALQSTVEF